eukprot:scaffold566590_cov13-Prasinocladus_malaysianus.AAC.1
MQNMPLWCRHCVRVSLHCLWRGRGGGNIRYISNGNYQRAMEGSSQISSSGLQRARADLDTE